MLTYQSHIFFLSCALFHHNEYGWQVSNAETSWDLGHFKETEMLGHLSGEFWLQHLLRGLKLQ